MTLIGGLGAEPKAGSATGHIIDATTATFAKEVIEASRNCLVLVDFWADWCGPCKQLTPILEKVVGEYKGGVRLVKINVDQNQQLAQQLRIQSLPTVYAFRDGRPLDGFMGLQTETAIREFIERCGGGGQGDGIEEVLETAREALEAGNLQDAAEVFAAVLEEDQLNPKALAGLATCYLRSGDVERAEQTLALVPPNKANDSDVVSTRAAIELAKQTADAGPVDELQTQVAADPGNLQLRFDLAMAAAAAGKKAMAVDELIEIFRRDRTWNEDGARKQLVTFFEAWGHKDKATIDGRKRLSAMMFS